MQLISRTNCGMYFKNEMKMSYCVQQSTKEQQIYENFQGFLLDQYSEFGEFSGNDKD